ncbi:glycoside hydrolase family 32 protein [Neobacillus cucumis]|uniref:Sucrose-6-phosphate hydrolase n=1 Tax=Neobacillus cucumis TaxID=1740721 RepID=A0A2N5HDS6_9BACI|nr:sucrose-6-phosphate hydrolase [Neobacillus cucumis]PLS03686.1 sucrose-6-phosphate hydrolase [Neobacillus cucumis]
MIWTKEKRYRRIEEAGKDELLKLQSDVGGCEWRQTFHIQPETGLLNDPNGFSFFNGEYHLFYQWFPLGPVHGLKYWYHTKSKDLVHWENVGIGIEPSNAYDSHGAYSGSAIEHDGKLYLLYTGNTRDENWVRHPYQCLAIMDPSGRMEKLEQPVINHVPNGYTDHFRDPKVWKAGNEFYAVIGAQRENETGCVVLYRSLDMLHWEFKGELKTNLSLFGYMWECPDYLELQDKGMLIFSPQGISPDGEQFQNIYQSGYILGEPMDVSNRTLTHGSFQELDRGFDFYAPQTMLSPDGRRILIGWMGLPEMEYPTDRNGWAHCLTLPRELSIKDDKLIQKPVQELQVLRKQKYEISDVLLHETKKFNNLTGTTYEMLCEFENFDAAQFGIEFRAGDKEKTILKYDTVQKKVILDRTFSGEPVGEEYGTVRECSVDGVKIKFHLFVDISSVEIFINDGEEVFTSRIFPKTDSNEIRFFAEGGRAYFQASKWDI